MNLPIGRLAVMACAALLVAACSSSPGKGDRPENPFKTAAESPGGPQSPLSDRELRQQAAQLYRRAREALDNTDYTVAIQRYDALIARYPFSDYSTQAELEKIYAQYKAFQADEAVAAADRFLRAHPRNIYADYVMYLKGVTDFERDNGLMDEVMPSTAKRDIGNQRRAFEDFAALLQRYPKSHYAGDARRRMLYSRNRIADHELSVAQFYVTRGAYVAAAKRASDIITEYPGAPATAEALKILQRSYARIGLQDEAKDTAAVIALNSDKVTYTEAPKPGVVQAAAAPQQDLPPPPAQNGQQAAAAQPGNNGVAADDGEKRGLVSRFAGMFGFLDSSKPENQHTFVIGGDGQVSSAANGSAAAAPAGGSAAATPSNTTVNGSSAVTSVHLSVEGPTQGPADTAPAAPAAAAPKAATQPDNTQAQDDKDKPGFFTWFAGLFSFFDRTEPDPAPTPVPAPKPADSSK